MIRLHPVPQVHPAICPACGGELVVQGWLMPGMRCLAERACAQCGHVYYQDLPAGHGLAYPSLLSATTGRVQGLVGRGGWFAEALETAYATRQPGGPAVQIESLRSLARPLVLNCLDSYYGHAVLRLLNAQYYLDHQPEYDLIVIIPAFLRWLVPEGVAEIWQVEAPLRTLDVWYDGLHLQFSERLRPYETIFLSLGFSHPHPRDYAIERFTGITPFDLTRWWDQPPVFTFIWRDDRLWHTRHDWIRGVRLQRLLRDRLGWLMTPQAEQFQHICQLAEALRQAVPGAEIAVVGMGEPGDLPAFIADERHTHLTPERERAWCARYARSHVVIGVHGSNMLLPSAHAGATIDLMPDDRWPNLGQDVLFRPEDGRLMQTRYHYLPLATAPADVARLAVAIYTSWPIAWLNYAPPFVDHGRISADPVSVRQAWQALHKPRIDT